MVYCSKKLLNFWPGSIQSPPSKRLAIMPHPLSSVYPASFSPPSPSPAISESQLPCLQHKHPAASSVCRLAAVSVPNAAESCYNEREILPVTPARVPDSVGPGRLRSDGGTDLRYQLEQLNQKEPLTHEYSK